MTGRRNTALMPPAKSACHDTLCLIVAGHEINCSPNIFFLDSSFACPFFVANRTSSPARRTGSNDALQKGQLAMCRILAQNKAVL
jgi:hypothetical protein